MNNGVISNAKYGVRVGDELTNHNSGGIITFSNSSFINNRVSISMAPYNNIFNNGELMNRSSITNCNFLTNNDFFVDQTHFFCHVYLKGINGVIFSGCSFNSTMTIPQNTPFYVSFPNTGIRSINSRFTVRPTCNSTLFLGEVCDEANITHSSIFSGLNYGIVASSSGNFSNIEIKSTEFINNDYGIYISGVNNPKILKNRFIISKESQNITNKPVGLYLQNSTGFRIEENQFYNNSISLLDKIGLTIKNSREDNNIVYKNKFENLTIGQLFLGFNYNNLNTTNEAEGLVTICNENYLNTQYDIHVEPILSQKYTGINPFQTYLIKYEDEKLKSGANNKFSNPDDIDLQYNNEGIFINYYYNTNIAEYQPTKYFGIQPMEAVYENLCPSKINGLYPLVINSELTSITLEYANLKYNYNQLIDAGNTEELIKLIQDEWSEDIWGLRTELLGQSPYLSQEAILSVAEENLLPPALLLEICIANPDATKDEGFLEKLRCCIPTPLPEYMINLIKASWENKTLRTDMEEQLSAFKTYKDELFNYLTEIMLSDTIYDYSNIINHLGTRGSYSDYLSMAEIAINQDDFDQANLYLDILENNSEKLSEEEALEIASFRDYIAIRESLFLDSTTIYQLDSTQIASLETYASSNNYRGAILARNILCFLYDICIDDVPTPPKMLRIGSNSNNNQNTIPFIASVKVMPNPAHEYASFIWDMKSFDKNAILYIYDQNGKIIVTQPIDTKQGQWVWNIKNVPNGVYVYTLKSDQLILYSGKIIVNK